MTHHTPMVEKNKLDEDLQGTPVDATHTRNMNPVAAQQVALDNALVAPEKRLKIEKCNARIKFSKPQRETTYQVTLDVLKLSPCYLAFLITTEVPKIYMHQFWNTIKKIKDTDTYQFKLDKKKFRIDTEVFREILRFVLDSLTKILLNLPPKKKWIHLSKNSGTLACVICYLRSIQIICTSQFSSVH
ncbi:hypothetical protein Tco_0172536 [Tanacetum coccineum]